MIPPTSSSTSADRRIIAIGDVHGCARELESLLKKMAVGRDDLVVFLGDYVDRGNDSRGVVDLVLELASYREVVALKGNHEAMFLDFLNHPESAGAGLFVLNGGAATLANYAMEDGSIELPDTHLRFFQNLKLFHTTRDYFFVHAGVPNIPLAQLTEREHEAHLLWSRHPFLSSEYAWEKLIVHGHTPARQVEIRPNRINLDTGCVYDGLLTAMEFPSRQIFQVEKGIKNEPTIYPQDTTRPRVSMRFSGRLPVEARRRGSPAPPHHFETLNYNQFGILMREISGKVSELDLQNGDVVEGRIGDRHRFDEQEGLHFIGTVMRCESRGDVAVYGVRIDRLSGGMSGPQGERDWAISSAELPTEDPGADGDGSKEK